MPGSGEAGELKRLVLGLVTLQICLVLHFCVHNGQIGRLIDIIERLGTSPDGLMSGGEQPVHAELSDEAREMIDQVFAAAGFVNVQFLSAAFVEMTKSWVCNVRLLDADVLNKTVFLATDDAAYHGLKAFDPSLNVCRQVFGSVKRSRKEMYYGREEYFSLMLWRSELLMRILERGVSFLLTEADAVWLDSPFDVIGIPRSKHDIVVMDDQMEKRRKRKLPNGGFLFLKATSPTIVAWKEVVKLQREEMSVFARRRLGHKGSHFRNEQVFQKQVFESMALAGNLSLYWLPMKKFASGKFYTSLLNSTKLPRNLPYVILNNFITGVEQKVKRAKQFNHWFLSPEKTCIKTASMP